MKESTLEYYSSSDRHIDYDKKTNKGAIKKAKKPWAEILEKTYKQPEKDNEDDLGRQLDRRA